MVSRTDAPTDSSSLSKYLEDINKFPLLTAAEERHYAATFQKEHDLEAAHTLVTCNLRLVVKVAYEFREYGFKITDLLQEGNIGLMKIVQVFNPEKHDKRLKTYAVWWIRAYMSNYILKNWELAKNRSERKNRKLFFLLARTKRELQKFDPETDTTQPPKSKRHRRKR